MEQATKQSITVQAIVHAPAKKVWEKWTTPEDIKQWNFATPEWHSPAATNELRAGGAFNYRMEARDGSFGFDFGGVYDEVKPNELINYTLGDGRKVRVSFTSKGNDTEVIETFEAESMNSIDIQRGGWQAILDNFKKHAESGS